MRYIKWAALAFSLGVGMEVGQYLTFVVMNRLGVFGVWGGY